MICIAQQDMTEKYTRAPMSRGKPQRKTCVVRRHVCPGAPSSSKELNLGQGVRGWGWGATWMLSSHFKNREKA